jgi:hypothetical protein
VLLLSIASAIALESMGTFERRGGPALRRPLRTDPPIAPLKSRVARFRPRQPVDSSGYLFVTERVTPWPDAASLDEIARSWLQPGKDLIPELERMASEQVSPEESVRLRALQASCWNYEGDPQRAFQLISETRSRVEQDPDLANATLYTLIYLQGITSLRQGETENCVLCRGENSCILPISPAARHTNPAGSRQAIKYFTEYLERFPDDLEVRWLLNIAKMTLDEYPDGVDPKYRVALDRYNSQEYGIGKFRDVGHLVGLQRLNMAGGTILDDFDNDGLLDLVFTTLDPTQAMAFYKNNGDGSFTDRTKDGGLAAQLGGLNCVQADYNNDGLVDIFIPRGAWLHVPMRPSLMKNVGQGRFIDATQDAGLLHAMNSDTSQFADFDNDGWLDLFVCGEAQPCRLYRNQGDGSFVDVAARVGLGDLPGVWKGCSWFDYDNDGRPDLLLNNYIGKPRLFHNNSDGTFIDATADMGVREPLLGLSCWSWDYDTDGWLDIFATSYDRTLGDVIKGLLGNPHDKHQSKLYRNVGGKRFEDVTEAVGLDQCFSAMGSNFADFDNDGFLDFYLGTGDHDVATLVPNRMFRNLAGKRFVDVSSSSGTGHLQKGHGVGCGDWDRDGDVDIAIEMGGAVPGDKYHNVLFLNPGQGNHWLSVKLVGKQSNRSAIGARIKVVTAGDDPLTVQRCVCSGSSFGANPLEQLVGLGPHDRIATLEIYWPTSGTTQVFRDLPADQHLEITEFADDCKQLTYKPIPLPVEK